jgi:hypothetical protein
MSVSFQQSTTLVETFADVVFLPTGDIDSKYTNLTAFAVVEEILSPTISSIISLAEKAKIPDFNFWKLMNWMFVSHYWTILLDFGQVSSAVTNGSTIASEPVLYPTTNNIFVNETLFELYSAYLSNTVLPLLENQLPQFASLNQTNVMNASDITLKLLYSCTDLRLKSSGGLVVSVMVASWAFVTSLYAILVGIGSKWELRKEDGRPLVYHG